MVVLGLQVWEHHAPDKPLWGAGGTLVFTLCGFAVALGGNLHRSCFLRGDWYFVALHLLQIGSFVCKFVFGSKAMLFILGIITLIAGVINAVVYFIRGRPHSLVLLHWFTALIAVGSICMCPFVFHKLYLIGKWMYKRHTKNRDTEDSLPSGDNMVWRIRPLKCPQLTDCPLNCLLSCMLTN